MGLAADSTLHTTFMSVALFAEYDSRGRNGLGPGSGLAEESDGAGGG